MSTPNRTLREAVQHALDFDIRPRLEAHAGDISADVDDSGNVVLTFRDACSGCPCKAATAALGVTPFIEAISGVRSVSYSNVMISRHAAKRLAEADRINRGGRTAH